MGAQDENGEGFPGGGRGGDVLVGGKWGALGDGDSEVISSRGSLPLLEKQDHLAFVSHKLLELHGRLGTRRNRRLAVYLALSAHPVLKNNLTLPAHSDIFSPPIAPLHALPDLKHAITQKRISVIVSLMSLIGNRLAKDTSDGRIISFVSTTIGDGLNEVQARISTLPPQPVRRFSRPQQFSPFWILSSVEDVTLELAQLIVAVKDRLDLNADEEDNIVSVSSLGGGNAYRQYECDVKRNPSALLRPQSRIIIPKTKLTECLMHQLILEYRLGDYFELSENKSCFWRALRPCASDHHHVAIL